MHKVANPCKQRVVANRPYTLREKRLVAEFLAAKYPHAVTIQEPRLGPPAPLAPGVPATNFNNAIAGNARGYADALVIEPLTLTLVEGKIEPDVTSIAQLYLYSLLLPLTPELSQYKGRKVRTLAVWGMPQAVLSKVAEKFGVEVVVFTPPWVRADLQEKYANKLRMTSPGWYPPEILKNL